jgi:hypothetical protein
MALSPRATAEARRARLLGGVRGPPRAAAVPVRMCRGVHQSEAGQPGNLCAAASHIHIVIAAMLLLA